MVRALAPRRPRGLKPSTRRSPPRLRHCVAGPTTPPSLLGVCPTPPSGSPPTGVPPASVVALINYSALALCRSPNLLRTPAHLLFSSASPNHVAHCSRSVSECLQQSSAVVRFLVVFLVKHQPRLSSPRVSCQVARRSIRPTAQLPSKTGPAPGGSPARRRHGHTNSRATSIRGSRL